MNYNETTFFDSVSFFRVIKDKLSEKMRGMTLSQRKEFMKQIREGKIEIV